MPRIQPEKVADTQIYGKVKVDNTLTMGERIRKRFKPTDTVKVHNLTNTLIKWQWFEESDESYVIDEGSNIKIVERGDPQLWQLGPGEMDILQGSCAYLMIEALYKQMCAMKTGVVLHPLDEGEIKNFAFDDPQRQEEVIDLIFRGKVTPQMMQEAAVSSLGGDFKPQILEKLPRMATEQDEFDRRTGSDRRLMKQRMHETPMETDLGSLQDEFDQADGSKGRRPKTKVLDQLINEDEGNDGDDQGDEGQEEETTDAKKAKKSKAGAAA